MEEEPVEEEEVPKAASTGKKQKSKRELRKEQREVLRSKSLGLIRLSDEKQKPKKIVFGDDDDDDAEQGDDNLELVPKESNDNNDAAAEEEDGSDDDVVEQVSSKAARELALAELERERETKAAQAAKKKKKRKSRLPVEEEESSDEDEEMEEDFFAELDAQKSALRKARRSKGGDAAISKHTVFQSSNDDDVPTTPIEVMPGMELVVLEEDQENADMTTALSLTVAEAPSQSILHNSRVVTDGSDIVSAKQKQKKKKTGLAPPQPNWRRSQKTNRILLNKGRGKGKAASNFAVKANVNTYKF